MGLVDGQGQPLKTNKPPKEGEDLVRCDILVENPVVMDVTPPMMMKTPQGQIPVPMQKVLTSIGMNLYNAMKHMKAKHIIINLEDTSSELVKEKQFVMSVGKLTPPTDELEDETTEEKESQ